MNSDRVNDSLSLTVACPLCGAAEYSPCVYVWPKGVRECQFGNNSDICWYHSNSQHERLAKVGQPTKTTHNARKHLVFNRRVRERQLAELRQLSNWLNRYADIFKEEGNG